MWPLDEPGLLELPSGRRIRGRSLRATSRTRPDWGLYALGRDPLLPWPYRWVRWFDFALPANGGDARAGIAEAWERAATERVEVACGGGVGRTGTVLAAMTTLDGLSADDAVAWVRARYHPRAVETPWQRRWVGRSAAAT